MTIIKSHDDSKNATIMTAKAQNNDIEMITEIRYKWLCQFIVLQELNKKMKNLTSSGISGVNCSKTLPKTFRVAKTLFLFTLFLSNLNSATRKVQLQSLERKINYKTI